MSTVDDDSEDETATPKSDANSSVTAAFDEEMDDYHWGRRPWDSSVERDDAEKEEEKQREQSCRAHFNRTDTRSLSSEQQERLERIRRDRARRELERKTNPRSPSFERDM